MLLMVYNIDLIILYAFIAIKYTNTARMGLLSALIAMPDKGLITQSDVFCAEIAVDLRLLEIGIARKPTENVVILAYWCSLA